jgi:hypothetical protein
MRTWATVLFGLLMISAAGCGLAYLPQYRRKLQILRNAGQLRQATAEFKLRLFVILLAVWLGLGLLALVRALQTL